MESNSPKTASSRPHAESPATLDAARQELAQLAEKLRAAEAAREQATAEAQRLAQNLRELEARYNTVVEQTLQGIMIHQDSIIVYANAPVAEMFGYDGPEDLVGQDLWQTLPAPFEQTVLKERTAAFLRGERLPPHRGWQGRRKDGGLIWITANAGLTSWQGRPAIIAFFINITESKLAEQALAESEARFRTLVEHAPEAIVVFDVDAGVFVDVNDRACHLFGMTRDELLRHGPLDLGPPQQPDGSDSVAVAKTKIEQVLTGQAPRFEWMHRNAAGIDIPCEVFLVRLPSATKRLIRGSVINIAERKQAEAIADASRRMLQVVLDNIPQGVFWKDRQSVYLGCNRIVAQAFGLAHPDRIVGITDAELPGLTAEQAAFFVAKDREVIATNTPQLGIIEPATLADGSSVWLETNKMPLYDAQGKIIGVLGTWQDITERKRAADEREKLNAQIQHTQKLESLGVLAGGIAHDFNNLLTGILGYADLARRALPTGTPPREYMDEMIKGARRAADLTQQMLAYSGKGRFVVQPVNLSELVQDMGRLLEISISKKCVLKNSLLPDMPACEADATQLRQVIMNLVINASEATGEQSGVIAVSTGVMHCDRTYLSETYLDDRLPEGLYVYLEVADNGCGMDDAIVARVFDPFFTTKFTGRGLGLAAVLGIVRGHRGAVKMYTEPGEGTTFKILFPATQAPVPHRPPETAPSAEWRGAGVVLVVDDEETVRSLARSMLEAMGFTVLTAADGREGVEVYQREAARIRLVLLDMTMPYLDGAETYRELRRIRSDVRAILSSGYNEQTATGRFAGKGLSGFIQKPYRYEQLLTVVRAALEK